MQRRVSVLATAVAFAVGAAVFAGPIGATTGVSTGLPQPEVLVQRHDGVPFEGRFVLASIDKTANITGGQISAEYTETPTPYLVGFAEYGTFDNDGRRSMFTANLYPWSFDKKTGTIKAHILSQATNDDLGTLALKTPTDSDHVQGTLTLDGRPYAVTYRRVDEDLNLYGKLPKVQLTTPQVRLTKDGWGSAGDVAGKYRLSSASTGSASATVYAPLVDIAHRLASGPDAALDATLNIAADATSGVLSVRETQQSQTFYLTHLRSGGDARAAQLRTGSADGPVAGRLDATADGDSLTGTITVGGKHTSLAVERYAAP